MKITNKFGLPDTIQRAIENDDYSKGDAYLSVTQLLNSPRIIQLRKKHWNKLTQDISDRIWALFGSAIHHVLEKGGSNKELTEKRYFTEVNGWTISGQIDSLDLDSGILRDYKTCKAYSLMTNDDGEVKEEWVNQLNCYRYMLEEQEGIEVKALEIIAFIRDWSKYQSERSNRYPNQEVMVIPVPMWSKDETEKFLQERVRLHQKALASYKVTKKLPLCSDKERWMTDTKYALRKEGLTRAIKVYNSKEEIENDIGVTVKEDQYIEERKGKSIRCEGNYCNVAEYCSQYQGELNG